jgi:hypothetical protein
MGGQRGSVLDGAPELGIGHTRGERCAEAHGDATEGKRDAKMVPCALERDAPRSGAPHRDEYTRGEASRGAGTRQNGEARTPWAVQRKGGILAA